MVSFKKYIILWISQSVSQLGSSMTAFALILWTYQQTHSALSVSIMSFCDYVPYIVVSIFAGTFVDHHYKKNVMLVSDCLAAFASLLILMFSLNGMLSVAFVYLFNAVIGTTTAFQNPASSVAVAKLVPENLLSNVSGMNSFSTNLIVVFSPVIATVVFSVGGLPLILIFDLISFTVALFVLLFLIDIPEQITKDRFVSPLSGMTVGFKFLKKEYGILYIIIFMAVINFFSQLTYENILSPMILSRSSGNNFTLGIVNAFMGVGGIIGGLLVSFKKEIKNKANMIFIAAALSFLIGDLLMATGRNAVSWSVAAFAASLPIPFIMAGQNLILYKKVPENIQGRVFALRNAVQFSTIPPAILLGGYLADYIFEPFMQTDHNLVSSLQVLVGKGPGSGMAVMFLFAGICGFTISVLGLMNREIRKLND